MIYNTIMVQLDVDSPVAPRLEFAWKLAEKFEADLIAFAAVAIPALMVSAEGAGVAAEIIQQQTEETEARLQALKEEFMSASRDRERISWRGEIGDPTKLLALNSRAADLVVTAAPDDSVAGDFHRTIDVGTVILSAGRPVLLAADGLAEIDAEKVLVAWTDTREARRAVVDAMPFLTGAREVVVATIAEGNQKTARDSAADVVRFLMKHNVKANSDVLGVGSENREGALVDLAPLRRMLAR